MTAAWVIIRWSDDSLTLTGWGLIVAFVLTFFLAVLLSKGD